MKTLYLECGMGAAGDMLMAALLELIPDKQDFLDKMNALGLPDVHVKAEKTVKCGITGTHICVNVGGMEEESKDEHSDQTHTHHHEQGNDHGHVHEHSHHYHEHTHDHGHEHHHASIEDIESVIEGLPVSDQIKRHAKAVYRIIAEAESQVHGSSIAEIHFHEVGTMDAIADVVGVSMLMEIIGADEVVASPVHVGSGYVHCAHGVLPVPAPATALILNDVPTYGGSVQGELCTPTGAALLKHFVSRFGDRPPMTTHKVGYGMGKKNFERLNCVRAFLGEHEGSLEKIVRLECNLDDMTGEEIGFAMERLLETGARDVFTVPCGMKKNRPGILLVCIGLESDADVLAALIMKHTSTLGIRKINCERYTLSRRIETVQSAFGEVRVKKANGTGVSREKIEYDDLAKFAIQQNLSLADVRKEISTEIG